MLSSNSYNSLLSSGSRTRYTYRLSIFPESGEVILFDPALQSIGAIFILACFPHGLRTGCLGQTGGEKTDPADRFCTGQTYKTRRQTAADKTQYVACLHSR